MKRLGVPPFSFSLHLLSLHLLSLHLLSLLFPILLFLPACNRGAEDAYSPGLGEIMTLIQMRHAKLWFAGEAKNWPLAAYEVKELEEGFADVVRLHPTHEGSPVPITDLVPSMTEGPIDALKNALKAKDPSAFRGAFDALTQSCNACHQATAFGYNVVQRPKTNPFSNQDFALPK